MLLKPLSRKVAVATKKIHTRESFSHSTEAGGWDKLLTSNDILVWHDSAPRFSPP